MIRRASSFYQILPVVEVWLDLSMAARSRAEWPEGSKVPSLAAAMEMASSQCTRINIATKSLL